MFLISIKFGPAGGRGSKSQAWIRKRFKLTSQYPLTLKPIAPNFVLHYEGDEGPAGGRGPCPKPGYENVYNVAVTDIPPLPLISSYTTSATKS
ncbi:hypothetical protein CEXT_797911 [Caerostris extrusa]|uniref:Uncharacterized protein n=1 Tax=Caerostris extrusa TaxID=172846 RepID=A0AAV4W531_CAEEX|nr:hypothetical protein CEXT_797911 [Caerostris extrusa]